MKLQALRSRSRPDAEKGWSTVGDWVATVLVCLIFIGMLAAMLAVLLGEAK
jgi:hypothetical protein